MIIIKGSIHQEDITTVNIYASNIRASKNVKQILTDLKGVVENNIIVVEDFNTPLSTTEGSPRHKTNKGTMDLSYTLDEIYLTDLYRTFHLTAADYIFVSSAHEMFSKIDHILCHKRLSKFKKTEILNIVSDHNGMKLEANNKRKTRKCTNMWKLNNTFL